MSELVLYEDIGSNFPPAVNLFVFFLREQVAPDLLPVVKRSQNDLWMFPLSSSQHGTINPDGKTVKTPTFQ